MVKVPSVYATMQRNFAFNRETAEACKELIKEGVQTAKDPFYRKVIESQKKYDEQIVPFRLSWFPPYEFAGNYYWKDKVYRGKPAAAQATAK